MQKSIKQLMHSAVSIREIGDEGTLLCLAHYSCLLYETDHCTVFGPCSARGITSSSLLLTVC